MQANIISPRVSILMPTYRHAAFIRRALHSLRTQSFEDWELVIIDDGSDDDTAQVLAPYLADARLRYHRLERNGGLGNALNLATSMARGQYIAYLPSDDFYLDDHLARLVAVLDARPEVYLAYGGLRWTVRPPCIHHVAGNSLWTYAREAPTLQGQAAVDAEKQVLERVRQLPEDNNLLAMVQVMHRRTLEAEHRWAPRAEIVSDRLEPDFWWGLLARDAVFAYAGAITAEWVAHADNRHEIISNLHHGGLSRYREYYGIAQGEALNWQPSKGFVIDERVAYARWRQPRALPAQGGLEILLAGELGFNAERIVAFEEHGHKLYGLWASAEIWDTASTTAYGNVETIPRDARWRERVRELRPDIIYAQLNWQALPLIDEILAADLGIPVAFHFKEAPFLCLQRGLWPALMRALSQSDGQILFNEDSYEWFQQATDGMLERERVLVMEGDLLKQEWLTEDWSPKLSAQTGQIHTVCVGRPLGLDPRDSPQNAELVLSVLSSGIHVHLYGGAFFRNAPPEFLRQLEASGLIHYHGMVHPQNWVRELSQYDAAWCHIFRSNNHGDLRRASWTDLNQPARLGTYAAAGLPWLLYNNSHSRVAVDHLARRLDVGIFFDKGPDLAVQLRDRARMQQLTDNMRRARKEFCFDAQLPRLIEFFHGLIERRKRAS